jgi:hypothetical protein
MSKANVYYLGTYSGKGKTSGKPYNRVDLLEYNSYFKSWSPVAKFLDSVPAICATLVSGDYVEIELSASSSTSAPQLVGITKKLADSPLKIN